MVNLHSAINVSTSHENLKLKIIGDIGKQFKKFVLSFWWHLITVILKRGAIVERERDWKSYKNWNVSAK